MLFCPIVEQGITWPGIKAENCRAMVCGQVADIGDTAYIDDGAIFLAGAKQKSMESGSQGCRLAAEGDVFASEISRSAIPVRAAMRLGSPICAV